jgi:hypothetical protein
MDLTPRRRVALAVPLVVLLGGSAHAQWWRNDNQGSTNDGSNDGSNDNQGSTRQGFTRPEELQNLLVFRDAMRNRSMYWQEATQSWNCPDDLQYCNPCGDKAWGYWDHVGCRGGPIPGTSWGSVT